MTTLRPPGHAARPRPIFLLLAVLALACAESEEERVASDRVDRYREKIATLVDEDCDRHGTLESSFASDCEAASTLLHERMAEILAGAPRSWESRVLSLAGICRAEAYRYAQSEYEGRSEPDLLVEGLSQGPGCLETQFDLLKDIARREGVPVPGD